MKADWTIAQRHRTWKDPRMAFVPVAVDDLVEQHASEAGFLWSLRDAATRSPAYDLDDLVGLDGRLEAHLDGLRVAGDTGWRLACETLADVTEPGEAFVAAKIALDRGDMKGFAWVLDQVEATPELLPALPAAVGFCAYEDVDKVLRAMVARTVPPPLRAMGIAGFTQHRRDPGAALSWALSDDHQPLRLRGLAAAGDLGARHLLAEVQHAMVTDDPPQRFWASRSAALLGDPGGVASLERLAQQADHPLADEAARLAACLMDAAACQGFVGTLDSRGQRRQALAAAVASGAARLVSWLISCMAEPEHARLAGFALFAITGVEIAGELEAEPPEVDESEDDFFEDVPDDPDDDLPWPDAEAVATGQQTMSYPDGRLLLGRPAERGWLDAVLRDGPQPLRQIAAWQRCGHRPGEPSFDVTAPVGRQRAALSVS